MKGVRGRQPRSSAGNDRIARQAEAGFTLLEIVCALAIVALLAAIALPALPLGTPRARLEAYAMQAAAIFEGDHYAAMRKRAGVETAVDSRTRTIASGAGGRSVAFPSDVTFDAMLATRCAGMVARPVIAFFPNGMSCGGSIALTRNGEGFEIRVNWLTGGTEVVPRRRS